MSDFFSTTTLLEIFVKIMMILLILPLHEFAHAWTANKLGDDTAKYMGRMTVNPFAHIDPIGALLLLFCGFGWAKPVPVNPLRFKNSSRGMMLTALAGPVSNLLAAIVGMIAWQLLDGGAYVIEEAGSYMVVSNTMGYAMWMLHCFIVINVNLALFNLIPVPPLDGSRILSHFLPHGAQVWLAKNEQICHLVVMALMVTGVLAVPLRLLNQVVMFVLQLLLGWIPPVL